MKSFKSFFSFAIIVAMIIASYGTAFAAPSTSAQDLSKQILNNTNITLAKVHPSGVKDSAYSYTNVLDTSKGSTVSRSKYGNAPGGTVDLNEKMLKVMLGLANDYKFSVSEIAGASHAKKSKHYLGIAFDVNIINGKKISKLTTKTKKAFVAKAKALGATYCEIEASCIHIDVR